MTPNDDIFTLYDRADLLALLQDCQTGACSCLFALNAIETAHETEVAKRDAALREAETALTLAYDHIEVDEDCPVPEIAQAAAHINASIRAVLAKIRPLLPKPPIP